MSDDQRTDDQTPAAPGPASREEPADRELEPAAGATDDDGGAPRDEAFALELSKLQEEVDRLRELYLRKMADFENYRKRQERELADFRRLANADLMRDALPVLDNLERALAVPGGDGSGLRSGVELVLRQLRDVLQRHGLIELDPSGERFDPAIHEAVARQEAGDVDENTVVQVYQKGYLLGEKLLRPAMVVVAVRPASRAGGEESQT